MAFLVVGAAGVNVAPRTSAEEQAFSAFSESSLDLLGAFGGEHREELAGGAIEKAEGRNGTPGAIMEFALDSGGTGGQSRVEIEGLIFLPFD
jgi:hypothetical protein